MDNLLLISGKLQPLHDILNIENNYKILSNGFNNNYILILETKNVLNNFNYYEEFKKFLDENCKNIIPYMIKKIILTAYDNINKLKVAEIYDNDTFNESKIYSMMILSGIILTDEENYTGEIVIKSIDGIRKNFTIYNYNKLFDIDEN